MTAFQHDITIDVPAGFRAIIEYPFGTQGYICEVLPDNTPGSEYLIFSKSEAYIKADRVARRYKVVSAVPVNPKITPNDGLPVDQEDNSIAQIDDIGISERILIQDSATGFGAAYIDAVDFFNSSVASLTGSRALISETEITTPVSQISLGNIFANAFIGDFDVWEIELSDFTVDASASELLMSFGIGTFPVTYDETIGSHAWNLMNTKSITPTSITQGTAVSQETLDDEGVRLTGTELLGTGAGQALSGKIRIYNPNTTSVDHKTTFDLVFTNSAGSLVQTRGSGVYKGTLIGGASSLRFRFDGSNIKSGIIRVYAISPAKS